MAGAVVRGDVKAMQDYLMVYTFNDTLVRRVICLVRCSPNISELSDLRGATDIDFMIKQDKKIAVRRNC